MRDDGVKRLREIVRVFTYYGFGFLVSKSDSKKQSSPEALRKAFEELGATFIKLGQILSTRPDLLPKNYIEELEKLQDNNSYTDFYTVRNIFYCEFSKDINQCFSYFEKKPFASASIAQVHRAILKDGKKVVVKVQHKDIANKMHLDLKIIKNILKITKANLNIGVIDPIELLEELEAATLKELDFSEEAKNILKFNELNMNIVCVTVPNVILDLSGKTVLTMEEIEGFKITDLDALETEGYDRQDVGKKLALSFCKQVFDDGFFHGDPHPGNLLVVNKKIAFIDFGIIGELSISTKKSLNKVMISIGTNDINGLIDFITSVGIVRGNLEYNSLYHDLQIIINKYLGISIADIKMSELLQEIFRVTNKHNIILPRELVILIRAIIILEGVVAKISPDIEVMDIVVAYIKEKKKKDIFKHIEIDELALKTYKFAVDGLNLTSKLGVLVDNISKGRVKVYFEISELKNIIQHLNKMVNRISFALVVGCMIIASSLVLNAEVGPKVKGLSIIGVAGYLIAGIFGLILLISIIKSEFF